MPQLPTRDALTVAVGMFGATVMSHAIYLHSGWCRTVRRRALTPLAKDGCASPISR
ncbi:divalent metal cation transporter [Pararobbsia alpina]|uniref:divalent metal cation transporter n=1 Tax=Pararobbsia alpina TaxID=621374 RepID=UPI001FEB9850|nr:divalent metal cation transporter [Pararobbsia alpina]